MHDSRRYVDQIHDPLLHLDGAESHVYTLTCMGTCVLCMTYYTSLAWEWDETMAPHRRPSIQSSSNTGQDLSRRVLDVLFIYSPKIAYTQRCSHPPKKDQHLSTRTSGPRQILISALAHAPDRISHPNLPRCSSSLVTRTARAPNRHIWSAHRIIVFTQRVQGWKEGGQISNGTVGGGERGGGAQHNLTRASFPFRFRSYTLLRILPTFPFEAPPPPPALGGEPGNDANIPSSKRWSSQY